MVLRGKERGKKRGEGQGASGRGGERERHRDTRQEIAVNQKEHSCNTCWPPPSDADGRGHSVALRSLHEVLHTDHSSSFAFPKATP